MHPEVDKYLNGLKAWKNELKALQKIVLSCGLTEEWKWKQPCYTINGGNVLMISGFKEYCCVSFFKGALLEDKKNILTKPGENSRSARQLRFANTSEIKKSESAIKSLIKKAIKNEQDGIKVDFAKEASLPMPKELKARLESSKKLKKAFEKLTPGRQRAYILLISSAKQSSTREARIEKFTPRILDGKGPNDCTCGLSKRMPTCDGSHKQLKK